MATWELFTSEYGDFGQKRQKKNPFGAPSQIFKYFVANSRNFATRKKEGPYSFWVSLNGNGF
jgi:hypothetical protein